MKIILSILCGLSAVNFISPSHSASVLAVAQSDDEGGSIGGQIIQPPEDSATGWTVYANDRFGFSVDIPVSFKSLPPPENGDGLTFVMNGKNAEIRAYGYYLRSKNLVDDAREQERLNSDLHVTYRQAGPNAYTLSGLEADRIVYIHAVKSCKSAAVAILRVEYPQSDKTRFDPLIAHMAKTLRGSAGCL